MRKIEQRTCKNNRIKRKKERDLLGKISIEGSKGEIRQPSSLL